MAEMTIEDKKNHKHMLNCEERKCLECKRIYREYFINDPAIKAVYKYQQTDKFKDYKKRYYQDHKDDFKRRNQERKKRTKANA